MKTACNLCLYFCLALNGFAAGWDTNVWGNADTNGITAGSDLHRFYIGDPPLVTNIVTNTLIIVGVSTNEIYTTNVLDNFIFVKEVLSSNSFAAIEERSEISGVAAATTNAWFRNNRADLVNVKSWINSNADEFYITNTWVQSDYISLDETNKVTTWIYCDGPGSIVFTQDFEYVSTKSLQWTAASLLSSLSLPSNYLTSTPWRKLTDSATTNGWHAIDDILNKLVTPVVNFAWVNKSGISGRNDGTADFGSWTNAQADAIANEITSNSDPQIWSQGLNLDVSDICAYGARYINSYANPRASLSANTNYNAIVDFYAFLTIHQGGSDYPGTDVSRYVGEDFFDAQGTAFTNESAYATNALVIIASSTNVLGTYTNTTDIGDSGLSQPTWCNEPDGTSGTTQTIENPWFNSDVYRLQWLGWRTDHEIISADYINSSKPITYYAD